VSDTKEKLIVVVGATAVGKTGLAMQLARHWNTEIVSADSRQVFREMAIGTAKPSLAQLEQIPHYFINTQSVYNNYDAGQYGRDALEVIHRLMNAHEKVILCGGSGLYIKAVCEGFDDFPDVPPALREKIIQDYNEKGLAWLQEEVQKNDTAYYAIVDRQNPQRLIRALELLTISGRTMNALRKKKKADHSFEIVKIGLRLERELLYQRIDRRVDKMMEAGLVEEARHLHPLQYLNALQTVGYAEIFGYLEGRYDLTETIRLIKRNTRNYAKRQMTWFNRDKEITWFGPEQYDDIVKACEG
jgi:tRNA dimethylallyltransferase